MAATAEPSGETQRLLNETDGELSLLLEKVGAELGLVEGGASPKTSPASEEEGCFENEEDVLKLLTSLEKAGRIMDLIDSRADKLLDRMDTIILDMTASATSNKEEPEMERD